MIGILHAVPLVLMTSRMLVVAVGHTYLARLVVGCYSISVQGYEGQGVPRLNSQSKRVELIKCVITVIDPPGMEPINRPLR